MKRDGEEGVGPLENFWWEFFVAALTALAIVLSLLVIKLRH
jgi:hypothetical protein